MSLYHPAFKIVSLVHGSGWEGLHVAVDHHLSWESNTKKETILTHEMVSDSEIDSTFDEMIIQLNKLRISAKKRLKTIKRSDVA